MFPLNLRIAAPLICLGVILLFLLLFLILRNTFSVPLILMALIISLCTVSICVVCCSEWGLIKLSSINWLLCFRRFHNNHLNQLEQKVQRTSDCCNGSSSCGVLYNRRNIVLLKHASLH
uniref:Uncharacterized protein n=1 Tax=Trichobilharzia regenti TaxID=157069 RepID=A0AA85J3J7_TRIRE|nr:unnamed protein product [Trichobilharzia regenti]